MTKASSSSPRHSNCSSVTCTREDKAKLCEGLAVELELVLPETKAMVGAEGEGVPELGLDLVVELT